MCPWTFEMFSSGHLSEFRINLCASSEEKDIHLNILKRRNDNLEDTYKLLCWHVMNILVCLLVCFSITIYTMVYLTGFDRSLLVNFIIKAHLINIISDVLF